MKTRTKLFMIAILGLVAMSCNSISEEDIQPMVIEAPESECFGAGCEGEENTPPPCYPNC